MPTVSICIPTFRRRELLRAAIESCYTATARPVEIIVSDDAHDKAIADMLAGLIVPNHIRLVYTENREGFGQSANVRNSMKSATGDLLLLLHDDDILLPGGLDALVEVWETQEGKVDAVYGRQIILDARGNRLDDRTAEVFAGFFKNAPEGFQSSPLWAALVQQFPNNSFLVRRDTALSIGYPSEEEVGHHPVDVAFGIRYALAAPRGFYFLHKDIAGYRMSETSIARSDNRRLREDGHLFYEFLRTVPTRTAEERTAMKIALARYAPGAIGAYINTDQCRNALAVLRTEFGRMEISTLGKVRLAVAAMLRAARLRGLSHWVMQITPRTAGQDAAGK